MAMWVTLHLHLKDEFPEAQLLVRVCAVIEMLLNCSPERRLVLLSQPLVCESSVCFMELFGFSQSDKWKIVSLALICIS